MSNSRNAAAGHWTGSIFPAGAWLFWAVASAVIISSLMAKPAGAQEVSTTDRWSIQGGPHVGVANVYRSKPPEFGGRVAAKRGTQVIDLSLSAIPQRYKRNGPLMWTYEAMAGLAWQPNALSMGFRSGIVAGPNALGEYSTLMAFGPHIALNVPIGSWFGLRGEGGGHLYMHEAVGLGARGYLRIGIEAFSR